MKNLNPTPPPATAVATILLLGASAASAALAQDTPRAALELPIVDVDLKTEHWIAPLKDGVAPSDPSHLSLQERQAYANDHRMNPPPSTDLVQMALFRPPIRSVELHAFVTSLLEEGS